MKDKLLITAFGIGIAFILIDLWVQYGVFSERVSFSYYEHAVGSSEELWDIGYALEDIEERDRYQRQRIEKTLDATDSFARFLRQQEAFAQYREARAGIQEVLSGGQNSSVNYIYCEEEGSQPLHIGMNHFRSDPRDECNLSGKPLPQNDIQPETMFEVIYLDGRDGGSADGEIAIRAISNGLFLGVERFSPYDWKISAREYSVGPTERFRLSSEGYLFSPISNGFFTCNSEMVKGNEGTYGNFNRFVLREVNSGSLYKARELADLYRRLVDIQDEYFSVHSDTAAKAHAEQLTHRTEEAASLGSDKEDFDTAGTLKEKGVFKIALVMPTTSKGTEMSSPAESPFFGNLFDSFMGSIDWASNRHVFAFFIGFDRADELYDTGDAWQDFRAEFRRRAHFQLHKFNWAEEKIEQVLSNQLSLTLHHYDHLGGSPSQIVSQLVLDAYGKGFDYFYQVNDDTIIETPDWPRTFISALSDPRRLVPNLGVTGPLDRNNDLIFTHAFVHRTHVDIFGYMFPQSFKNWWSDDWISTVYGKDNTLHLPDVTILHNVDAQKVGGATRYEIDRAAEGRLEDELRNGFSVVNTWLKDRSMPRLRLPSVCHYSPVLEYHVLSTLSI